MTIKGNTSEAIQFLQAWAPAEPWQLTGIVPDGRVITASFDGDDKVARARRWIEERNGRENIYFTVNPLMRATNVKASKTDIRGMACLHVDLDPRPGEDLDSERERAERLLREFKPAPTVIIDSGGGFQGFWVLEREQRTDGSEEKAAELEAYNLQIEVLLGADSCHNIDRIMRLPGTVNLPNEKKRKKGRIERLAAIVDCDWDRVYRLGQFTPAPRVQSREPSGSGPQVKISGNLPSIMLEDLPSSVSSRTKALIVNGTDVDDPGRYPSRSEVLFAVLCEMVRAGCTDDQIAAVIMDPDYKISAHVLEQPRPQSYVARQIQRAHEEAIDPWLRRLNEEHAVIEDIGGRCRVISEVMDYSLQRTRISRQSFDDFRNRYMHLTTTIGVDKEGNEVKMPVGKWWLLNSARRQYRTIMFAPGKEVTDSYNLWKGFACEARPGDCGLLLDHILQNVCSNNTEYAEYLINWMARCVQQPDSPGMVAVILRGRMGVGKSFVIKAFGSLWGRHFLQVSDPKHLVGSFNAHLRDCVVLFGDEAFYAGDKKHESILKTMVTEETIMIEGKGVDAEIAPNYVHLMMASNGEWVVPAGVDDRRFFVLDVGADKMQNKDYFSKIQNQLDNGGREAFLHFLMTRDLKGFEVRHYPKTVALQDQKIMSMSPEEQWWFEKLTDGTLHGDDWNREVPKGEIQRDYINYANRQKVMRPASPTGLGKFLQRVLPAQYPRAFQKMGEIELQDRTGGTFYKKAKIWFYEFPTLEQARSFWDERFGGPYVWPKIHELHEEEQRELETDTPF